MLIQDYIIDINQSYSTKNGSSCN